MRISGLQFFLSYRKPSPVLFPMKYYAEPQIALFKVRWSTALPLALTLDP